MRNALFYDNKAHPIPNYKIKDLPYHILHPQ